MADATVTFTLLQNRGPELCVRLRRAGDRWAAEVAGAAVGFGIARTAREALAAALTPLGPVMARVAMADLALLEPSRQLVEIAARREPPEVA